MASVRGVCPAIDCRVQSPVLEEYLSQWVIPAMDLELVLEGHLCLQHC